MNRRKVVWASVLAVLVGAAGLGLALVGGPARAEPPGATPPLPASAVRMVIDYKDGVQKTFLAVEHRADMTVMDATVEAGRHPRGIKLECTGKAEMAFVVQIDDLKNQGGGKTSRNWQFTVNGKLATRGVGVTTLNAGDTVVWMYSAMPTPE